MGTIPQLMEAHRISRIIAALVCCYLRGIVTRQEVAEALPDMGHWYLFCRVVEKEGGSVT